MALVPRFDAHARVGTRFTPTERGRAGQTTAPSHHYRLMGCVPMSGVSTQPQNTKQKELPVFVTEEIRSQLTAMYDEALATRFGLTRSSSTRATARRTSSPARRLGAARQRYMNGLGWGRLGLVARNGSTSDCIS